MLQEPLHPWSLSKLLTRPVIAEVHLLIYSFLSFLLLLLSFCFVLFYFLRQNLTMQPKLAGAFLLVDLSLVFLATVALP